METKTNKSLHPLAWVAGIAFIVFSGVGIAAFMGWIPTSTVTPGNDAALDKSRASPVRAYTRASDAPRSAVKCAECGVVQSVREIETKGEGSGIGAVVGGVLGNQVGGGDGKDIATVVGAVGGAVAGNEIEKRVKSTKSYEITVRFEDGSIRVIGEANAPAWRVGDKVKVVNGVIHSNV